MSTTPIPPNDPSKKPHKGKGGKKARKQKKTEKPKNEKLITPEKNLPVEPSKNQERKFNRRQAMLLALAGIGSAAGGALLLNNQGDIKPDTSKSPSPAPKPKNKILTRDEYFEEINSLLQDSVTVKDLQAKVAVLEKELDELDIANRPKAIFKFPSRLKTIQDKLAFAATIKKHFGSAKGREMKLLYPSEDKLRDYLSRYDRFVVLVPEDHTEKDVNEVLAKFLIDLYQEYNADFIGRECTAVTVDHLPDEKLRKEPIRNYLEDITQPTPSSAAQVFLERNIPSAAPKIFALDNISSNLNYGLLSMFYGSIAKDKNSYDTGFNIVANILDPHYEHADKVRILYHHLLAQYAKQFGFEDSILLDMVNPINKSTTYPMAWPKDLKGDYPKPQYADACLTYLLKTLLPKRCEEEAIELAKRTPTGGFSATSIGARHISMLKNNLELKHGVGVLIPTWHDGSDYKFLKDLKDLGIPGFPKKD